MKRVNTDELVKEIGDWRNLSDVISAGKVAVKLIDQYFTEGISFNQETTLCGRSVIKNIRRAKALGYIVELHYIGVDSVETAKQRVKNRVEKGGHGIPVILRNDITNLFKILKKFWMNAIWLPFMITRRNLEGLLFIKMERTWCYLIKCQNGILIYCWVGKMNDY